MLLWDNFSIKGVFTELRKAGGGVMKGKGDKGSIAFDCSACFPAVATRRAVRLSNMAQGRLYMMKKLELSLIAR